MLAICTGLKPRVKMLQHGDPELVAGYQLALAARFTSQHTRSSIGHHTAVASSDGALAGDELSIRCAESHG